MGFQAGVFYFDGREVGEDVAAATLESVRSDDCDPPAGYSQPGVFLACAASRWTAGNAGSNSMVTFDGRLDNRQDLRLQLRSVLRDDASDAALAAAAYEKWGAEGFARLLGDWSLAIWDRTNRAVLLASDFAGVRPLYYCMLADRALWSTRLGALVKLAQAREIDDIYVAGLLTFTGSPDRTPYGGIFSVRPGHAIRISPQGTRVLRFWQPPVADTIRYRRESDYEDQLRALFREAVRCRIASDSRCVSELSGGLDSSSVVLMARELMQSGEVLPERFATLTVEHEGSRDTPFYQAVEQSCGFESIHVSAAEHPFLTESNTGGALPGFWGPLQEHTSQICRRMGATTYLTGKQGDDIMGNWWDDSEQVAGLLRRGRIGAGLKQAFGWSRAMRIPVLWILWRAWLSSLSPKLVAAPRNRLVGAPELARDLEDSLAPAFRERTGLSDPRTFFSEEWMHARPERRRHWRVLMQVLELRKLQVPEPLEHLDYTHPFVHRPLVTFMASIPAEIVCGPGEPRRLMRRAFQQLWPVELRQRRSKDLFGGVFLDSLRPLANQLLKRDQPLQVVERGYVERPSLEARLERLALSMSCNENQLRQIILLEYWLRQQARHAAAFNAPSIPPACARTSSSAPR
jgi:asparagine synthase (glutamine-hydrolysing)